MPKTGHPIAVKLFELMKQTLTIDILTSGAKEIQTGVSGPSTTVPFVFSPGTYGQTLQVTRPCSLQPNLRKQRGVGGAVDGVLGSQATYICITKWFVTPVLDANQSMVIRVNGLYYPLFQQGMLQNPGGQNLTYEIGLEQPEVGR